ncbi:MAG: glycosyltransferase family 1 protein [Planctomycetota bacterium]|nr:MAG: glycosyltransferase family 1 protein [Planctomycetota bacterium]
MKVGFDIRPALFNRAGIGRYARELAGALSKLPEQPFLELFAPAWRGGLDIPKDLEPGRTRLHRGWLPARAMNLVNQLPGLDAGRFPAKIDVFHYTDYVYPEVRHAARVLTLHDAAFAVDPNFHGMNTTTLLNRVRNAISKAHLVIVVSETGRRDAELMGVDPNKVRVVPNGVNPLFQPGEAKEKDAAPYLLTVGTIEPRKNHCRTLVALENLWDKNEAPDWVIAGSPGWEYEDFIARMERSRHRKRIRWVKEASDHDLLELYRGAMALLYPSLHEGFGLPVLEAMACQIPVIVGRSTAPAWVAGKGAMLVDPANIDSIQEGIERILAEDWWRKQAAAVLHLRSKEFTWHGAAETTFQVYQEASSLAATPVA